MDFVIDVFNYILTAIMIGICGTWIFFIKSMTDTFTLTPYLDIFEKKETRKPKVSIILPARNEEEFIAECLDTLIDQDYEDYEIIAIDDSSEDNTGRIISEYAKNIPK